MIKKHILWLFALTFFIACSNDDDSQPPTPITPTDNKVLVINEGNFGQANGSLSEINVDNFEISQDIVGIANSGIATGDVVQCVERHNGKLYVVANSDSKVLILDEDTYVQEAIIESELSNPRYLEVVNEKIYITNWNSDFFSSYVAVFDANTMNFLYRVDTDPGTERIHFDGSIFWVSNNFTNTVQTFGLDDQSVQNTFTITSAPNGIAQIGNSLFVLCQDSFSGLEGAIYEFDIQSVSLTNNFELNLKPGKDLIAGPDDRLYFNSGTSVYASNFNGPFNEGGDKLAFTNGRHESIYGLGISGVGDIWIGDARGFSENGKVYHYNATGELINSWTSGIGPNGFVFF